MLFNIPNFSYRDRMLYSHFIAVASPTITRLLNTLNHSYNKGTAPVVLTLMSPTFFWPPLFVLTSCFLCQDLKIVSLSVGDVHYYCPHWHHCHRGFLSLIYKWVLCGSLYLLWPSTTYSNRSMLLTTVPLAAHHTHRPRIFWLLSLPPTTNYLSHCRNLPLLCTHGDSPTTRWHNHSFTNNCCRQGSPCLPHPDYLMPAMAGWNSQPPCCQTAQKPQKKTIQWHNVSATMLKFTLASQCGICCNKRHLVRIKHKILNISQCPAQSILFCL